MGVEVIENKEDDEVVFSAEIDFRDSDFKVLAVRWQNGMKYRYRLTIQSPNKADIVTTIEKGAAGSRTSVPNGYFIDGPLGAGYQLEPLAD